MDQSDLDPGLHRAALQGLKRLNSVSRSSAILWPPIAAVAAELYPTPLRVLDLACGSGDNSLALAKLARKKNLDMEFFGCDISPVAISTARQAAQTLELPANRYFQRDILRQSLPSGFHVIMCSLFLHHLSHEDAIELMRKMATATERVLLICDLRRTWRGMGLAWAGSRLLTNSAVVRVDAVRSVAAAFVESEIDAISADAGLNGCTISQHWPQRWLLSWSKS
ncbi:MAG: methyltransferase domain-containing protein [Planctomycetota bacterium]|nr:methyltransferase domain-containing protein [Planctomycetota bacterium]